MKKIYMILAALSLLSLSLNAQDYVVAAPAGSANTATMNKAPQRLEAGQAVVGPYTTEEYTTGLGITSYTGANHYFGVMLEPEEFEQYLGSKIVAFRAGFYQENDLTLFFVYQAKLYDDGTFTIGTGQEYVIDDGDLVTYDAGWHTIDVPESQDMHITLDEGFNRILIGYQYHQYSATNYLYPIGAITNCPTEHKHFWKRGGGTYDWAQIGMPTSSSGYYAMAMQLIVEEAEKTATPTITYSVNDDGSTVTINVQGDGEVHMYVDGNEVPFPYTVNRGIEDYDIIVTATAQEEGKLISDVASRRITIPKTTLPSSNTPTISAQTGDFSVEVTGEGTGEVHLYIDGREVENPWYLERTDEDYTVVVRVTNTDEGCALVSTTQTIVVPKRTVDPLADGDWTELPGTYNDNDVINWGKNMMVIDRFTQSTKVYDEIKTQYTYVMQENKTEGRKTNTKDVQALKSVSRIQGFYTEDQVMADRDLNNPTVELSVLNANVSMDLEHRSDIYYYTLDRALTHASSTGAYNELSELQRNLDGTYTEMGDFFTNENFDDFQGANKIITVDRLDDINVETGEHETIKGTFGQDYINYVPVVWSFGFDRVNYANDGKNNSYGSPIWTASVGQVKNIAGNLERQAKNANGDWNANVNWKDENNEDCSVYVLGLSATGVLPTIDNADFQNVDYEPYMFRVWVDCDGLRDYQYVQGTGAVNVIGDRTSPKLIYEQRVDDCQLSVPIDRSNLTPAYPAPTDPETPTNIVFSATNASSKHFIIRFYYKVKEEALDVEPEGEGNGQKLRANRDGGDLYYGVGDEFDPSETTAIISHFTSAEVVDTIYVNPQGMQSETPFSGLNIVITRYSDGSTKTTKIIK